MLSRHPEAIKSLEVFSDLVLTLGFKEKYVQFPKEFVNLLPGPELGQAAIDEFFKIPEVQQVPVNRDFRVQKLELKNLKSLSLFRDQQFLNFIQGFQLKVFRVEKCQEQIRDLNEFLKTQNELEELHMDESASSRLFSHVNIDF